MGTMRERGPKWTDDMVLYASVVWKKGVPSAEIAALMCDRFPDWPVIITKNVVLGVANRLRCKKEYADWFPPRQQGPQVEFLRGGPMTPPSPRKHKPPRVERKAPFQHKPPPVPNMTPLPNKGSPHSTWSKFGTPLSAPEDMTIEKAEAGKLRLEAREFTRVKGHSYITLMQLRISSCRWPFNGASGKGLDTVFCGEEVRAGYSYCTTHQRQSVSRR